MPVWAWILVVLLILTAALAVHDLTQRRHTILRNFPVVGHLRYGLESIGPELRQYIVTDNDAERPFSRDERRWVYEAAGGGAGVAGFGTDNDLDGAPNYLFVHHAAFPVDADPTESDAGHPLPCAKVLGGPRGRRHAFRPASVVNLSSMSYGSLGPRAIESLNRGAVLAGCWQGTGEGGISPFHREGGDLIWQIGTGYFGCRDAQGRFDLARLVDAVAGAPVRAIEIKLSQGAKPGLGGVLPGAKVTPEVAAMRGIPVGETCHSPARHRAFGDVDSMLDFVELIAAETGLPVGIKSAVGEPGFWDELAHLMATTGRGVDHITVDGGEGGTGAAPLPFADNVALAFLDGFPRVYRALAEAGVVDDVVLIGSGRLGLPVRALAAFALGVDAVNTGREAMLSIGCIQAQRCHTGRCPTGVATSSRWLQRGVDPTRKSVRCASYVEGLRRDLLRLTRATGVGHPALVDPTMVEERDGSGRLSSLAERHRYEPGWGVPSVAVLREAGLLA
ncbi:MAG: glutamate synthase-related protein [Actinomycetota bacterium]